MGNEFYYVFYLIYFQQKNNQILKRYCILVCKLRTFHCYVINTLYYLHQDAFNQRKWRIMFWWCFDEPKVGCTAQEWPKTSQNLRWCIKYHWFCSSLHCVLLYQIFFPQSILQCSSCLLPYPAQTTIWLVHSPCAGSDVLPSAIRHTCATVRGVRPNR